ncbi:Imm26 family immunity protein [Exiguobacterium aestuarii]|uniref:Imm26 family immunity protein n=1 Tax=Exiguobacterium aestuarii TaxID=273527 RepID=A0ABW2PJ53_9BACL|nr:MULTISPECIES: Imm26 family immunity protein [Exiguobacterium]MCT4787347.1 immunity 26/phosphotriesterase HocA family protein [Exiguobacterium aestuarii]
MARKKKVKVKIGDIFSIKLNENLFSYGQVLSIGPICDFLIIFDLVSDEHPLVKGIPKEQIIFLVPTIISRIEDGLWEVLGNESIPEIHFPNYKEETQEGYQLIDYLGNVKSEGKKLIELDKLKELESWSPSSVENATRARFLGTEWNSYYDDLIYDS